MLELIWTTRMGQQIPISQMTTQHIENCVAKIRRSRRGWRQEYLPRLELELQIRDMGLR